MDPVFFCNTSADMLGAYHLYILTYVATSSPSGAIYHVHVRQLQKPWFTYLTSATGMLSETYTPFITSLAAASTWLWNDYGQIVLPTTRNTGQANTSNIYILPYPHIFSTDTVAMRMGMGALVPVDGDVFLATLNNPTLAQNDITNYWLWVYWDGDNTATAYSLETGPIANPAVGGGSYGNATVSQSVNINPTGDSIGYVDPTTNFSATSGGVNQWCIVAADDAGTAYPVAVDIQYSPRYLQPT